jgi:CRP/FNR family transcriptional regulator
MGMPGKTYIIPDCSKCVARESRLFCNLSDAAISRLQKIKVTAVYPKGTLICLEGQEAHGLFILCTGSAKVTTTSAEGKSIILRIALKGEVLGLTAVLSNDQYEATVEILEPSQANFISQSDFMLFIRDYPEVGIRAAVQLTHNCKYAYDEVRTIGLSKSAAEKLARLILKWSGDPTHVKDGRSNGISIHVTLTQEEIGQLVGASRETVSRGLAEFKKKGWLRTKGVVWTILDRQAFEKLTTT